MANAIVRQEINILDAVLSAAGGSSATSNAIVQLDTTQYTSPTYYFEVVADSTVSISFNVTLRRKGTSTDDATCTIPLLSTSFKRVRSASFTPPAGQTEYVVFIDTTAGATKNVNAARIVVIDSAAAITNTQTQIEIGNQETAKTNTASAALTNPKYWLYTAANWDGVLSFSAEACWTTSAKNTTTITLQEDNGSFASWVDKVTIVSAGSNSTGVTRTRVAFGFTPTDGRHYRIASLGSTTKSNYSIYNAKIIVSQVGATVTTNYYFNDSNGGSNDPNSAWTNDANAFDLNTATYASTATTGSATSNYLEGLGTNAPNIATAVPITSVKPGFTFKTQGGTITCNLEVATNGRASILVADESGSGNGGPFSEVYSNELTVPPGGWTWSIIALLQCRLWAAPSTGTSLDVARVGLKVVYGDGATGLTKIESQYLLLNTSGSGTGQKFMQTLWDSTEWNDTQGGAPTFEYSHDATNAADSSKLIDIDNGNANVTGATVTGANQQISAAFTMPTTGHQVDTNVTVSTGVVGAVRILAIYTVNSVAVQNSNFLMFMGPQPQQ